jgi:hypothetical protein
MKRSGSAIFLMEFIIVILFFSLSVVVTLQMFVTAHQMDTESTQINGALLHAQNVAEQFKATGAVMFTGGDWTEEAASDGARRFVREAEDGFLLAVLLDAGDGAMESGGITVYPSGKESAAVCSLALGRYDPAQAREGS